MISSDEYQTHEEKKQMEQESLQRGMGEVIAVYNTSSQEAKEQIKNTLMWIEVEDKEDNLIDLLHMVQERPEYAKKLVIEKIEKSDVIAEILEEYPNL